MSDQSPWASPEPQSSEPQRPQYGEYAPGYVPQQQPAPQPPPPAYQQPQQYGQPAPGQAYGPGYVLPRPPRTRKTWDVVVTSILLVFALFGTLIALFYAANLPMVVRTALEQLDTGASVQVGDIGWAQVLMAVSHIVIFLAVLGISIPMLVSGRRAFWLPLAGGVLAALIFWGLYLAVALGNPAFQDYVSSRS